MAPPLISSLAVRVLLYGLLFLSGATSLVYEVVWTRVLQLCFGSTQLAISTVLATFMGGLALGGHLGGRFADRLHRPVLVYGLLEGVIGVYALVATPLLFRLEFVHSLLGANPSVTALTFFRFVFSALLMLVPTVCMGATLPVLCAALASQDRPAEDISKLYFANTMGAVVGTVFAGFVLIGWLGLVGTVGIAAMVGIAVGAVAMTIQVTHTARSVARHEGQPSPESAEPSPPAVGRWLRPRGPGSTGLSGPPLGAGPTGGRSDHWFAGARTLSGRQVQLLTAFAAAAFTGAAALANEVVWTRVLAILLDGTVYGFSALLAAFLCGIALGSAVLGPLADGRKGSAWDLLAAVQVLAGLGAALTMAAIPFIPSVVSYLISGGITPQTGFLLKCILVFFVVLAPTVFYGASFPIIVKLAAEAAPLSQSVGKVYAANTVGAIVGALGAGILLPGWGLRLGQIGLYAVALSFITALMASGTSLLWHVQSRAGLTSGTSRFVKTLAVRFGVPAALFFVVLAIRPDFKVIHLAESRYAVEDYSGGLGHKVRGLRGEQAGKRLLFSAEGKHTVVTVHKLSDGGLRLRNNGLNEAYHGPHRPRFAEVIFYLGVLPYVLHPAPLRAMVIGLGGGGTVETLLHTRLERIEVVELEDKVVEASRFMYAALDKDPSTHPLNDPRAYLFMDDGRNALSRFARNTPNAYDLIISQPSHPWLSGVSNLYTLEHFRIARKNLGASGLFCQWINLFRMDETAFRSVMASLIRVFKSVHVFQPDKNSVLVIAAAGEFLIDPSLIRRRFEEKALGAHAGLFGVDSDDLLLTYAFGPETVRRLVAGASPNTDRNPMVESRLPWVEHEKMLDLEQLLIKRGLVYGLTAEVLSPGTSTPELWSKLAQAMVSGLETGQVKVDRVRRFLKRIGSQLGVEGLKLSARVALYQGAEREALDLYQKAAGQGDLESRYLAGKLRADRGELTEALPSLERSLGGPWEQDAMVELSALLIRLGQHQRALNLTRDLISGFEYEEDVPARALVLMGEIERRQGNLGRAAELLTAHLAVSPDSYEGHYQMGLLLESEGRSDEARRHLRTATRLEASLVGGWSAKGQRAAEAGHLETAERWYRRSVTADPGFAGPYKWMARAFRKAGKYARMREVLEEMKRRSRSDDTAWHREFHHSATLAERLGAVLTEERKMLEQSGLLQPPASAR